MSAAVADDARDRAADEARRARTTGGAIVVVFWITSMVEGLGVSQVFAFLAPYLREIGVPGRGSRCRSSGCSRP